jgi:hypothetical protein
MVVEFSLHPLPQVLLRSIEAFKAGGVYIKHFVYGSKREPEK